MNYVQLPGANSVFPINAIVPTPRPAMETLWPRRNELAEAIFRKEMTNKC